MKKKNQYWIVPIFGCVDPEVLIGPYKSYSNMVRYAKKVKAKQSEEDAIFWLRTGEFCPTVGCFTNVELEEQ